MTEYTQAKLVEVYDAITDPAARLEAENGFFGRQLEGKTEIFEAAAGVGIESIDLTQKGFNITANEVDENFRRELEQRVKGLGILILSHDWLEIPDELTEQYDGLMCVGNSITYMMTEENLNTAIGNFAKLVKKGGIVIVDHRNYDYILDDREHILEDPKNNFRFKKKYYYVGKNIDSYYVRIEDDLAVQEVAQKDGTVLGTFPVHPWRVQEITEALKEAGLEDRVFSDFVEGIDMTADFFQHVAVKI